MTRTKSFILAFALWLAPALSARAQMFAGLHLGCNWPGSSADPFVVSPDPLWRVPSFTPTYPGQMDSAFLFGLKFGAWFAKGGVLKVDFPDWMKNTGFYLDFTTQAVNFSGQFGTKTIPWPSGAETYQFVASSGGHATTLAFMFAYRFGFNPRPDYPEGRWRPFVALGPALMFSGQKPTATAPPSGVESKTDVFPSVSKTALGLAVDAGLSWMAAKNISVDAILSYRYAGPTYVFSVVDEDGYRHTVAMNPKYGFLSLRLGGSFSF